MITDYSQMLSDVALRQANPGFAPSFDTSNECGATEQPIAMPKHETSINSKEERRIQAFGLILIWHRI
jgi:hypothetical protein